MSAISDDPNPRQVVSRDARTREVLEEFVETTEAELEQLCRSAQQAARPLDEMGRRGRAAMLRDMAGALRAREDEILDIAGRETALTRARLSAELSRTCHQLEFFAGILDDGAYLEVSIVPAHDSALGPQPDLRRMLVPIGPVAVFAASNFPLAFSVPGGDTASALAAGNPVIVKAHGSHLATSALCAEILQDSARRAGAPEGTIALVRGRDAGIRLVAHPVISAVGFTGSPDGGRALMRVAEQRDRPIPFYGELGSINPLVISETACRDRRDSIASGLVQSVTASAGQLCTKPGLVLIPRGPAGDGLLAAIDDELARVEAQYLLDDRILGSFRAGMERLEALPGASTRIGALSQAGASTVSAVFVEIASEDAGSEAFAEHFGPAAVVVRYRDEGDLLRVLSQVEGSLTASFHGPVAEIGAAVEALSPVSGRLVFDGFPTGVAVSMAQHHGGPWPASNSLHTSVGGSAIRRFLRPITWQDAPFDLLPDELRPGR